MTRDIDIALLRAFLAVVETGGVTTAARILNRTQAAVSLQIKRLEELFGTELFLRERKRFTLSPAGERLFGSAQRLVALNDAQPRPGIRIGGKLVEVGGEQLCAGALGLEERIEKAAVLVLLHQPRPRNGVSGAHVDHAVAAIGRR